MADPVLEDRDRKDHGQPLALDHRANRGLVQGVAPVNLVEVVAHVELPRAGRCRDGRVARGVRTAAGLGNEMRENKRVRQVHRSMVMAAIRVEEIQRALGEQVGGIADKAALRYEGLVQDERVIDNLALVLPGRVRSGRGDNGEHRRPNGRRAAAAPAYPAQDLRERNRHILTANAAVMIVDGDAIILMSGDVSAGCHELGRRQLIAQADRSVAAVG